MKRLLVVSLFFIFHSISFGQTETTSDSVTILIKNISRYTFVRYTANVGGQEIRGQNLLPANSEKFRIPLKGVDKYSFKIVLDKNTKDITGIEPMNYFFQENKMKFSKGTYTFFITIDNKLNELMINPIKN